MSNMIVYVKKKILRNQFQKLLELISEMSKVTRYKEKIGQLWFYNSI